MCRVSLHSEIFSCVVSVHREIEKSTGAAILERILLLGDGSSSNGASPAGDSSGEDPSDEPPSGTAPSERPLSPRIRRLKEKLGKPAPEAEMDEDTRRWVETAAEKHA
jgi:hypothetical protein